MNSLIMLLLLAATIYGTAQAQCRTCEQVFARIRIIPNLRGMADVLLVSIHTAYTRGMAFILLVCHAPLINDHSSASKCLLACKCDVVLEGYHIYVLEISSGYVCSVAYVVWDMLMNFEIMRRWKLYVRNSVCMHDVVQWANCR